MNKNPKLSLQNLQERCKLSLLLGSIFLLLFSADFAKFLCSGYMAQEYIDHGIISSKADIFSLGVIIIEIITGHRDYPISARELKHLASTIKTK